MALESHRGLRGLSSCEPGPVGRPSVGRGRGGCPCLACWAVNSSSGQWPASHLPSALVAWTWRPLMGLLVCGPSSGACKLLAVAW